MNQIAVELNRLIEDANPDLFGMLSGVGKGLFFPKGILTQSAEAKEKAHRINATVGIAKEEGGIMHLPSVMSRLPGMRCEESITYAPSFGIPELRRLWAESLLKKNPSLAGKDISLPVVTSGITHAISVSADLWVDPGDTIILPEMMWGNYRMVFSVRKSAEIVTYRTFNDSGGYDLTSMERAIRIAAEKTKKLVVVLNFPHNPSGYTLTAEEGERAAEMLLGIAEEGIGLVLLFDDSYFGLFYEPDTLCESLFARLAGSHKRIVAVKMDGATKENFAWGLRVGFITYGCFADTNPAGLYEALEKKTAGCVRGSVSNVSHLSQSIVLQSMTDPAFEKERAEKKKILLSRARKVKEVLSDSKYSSAWDIYPFNSGYFMCLKLRSVDAESLRKHLLEKYEVGCIATGKRDLRVAFSCVDEKDIQPLFEIIYKGVQDLSQRGV